MKININMDLKQYLYNECIGNVSKLRFCINLHANSDQLCRKDVGYINRMYVQMYENFDFWKCINHANLENVI